MLEVYLTTAAVYGGSVVGIYLGQGWCVRGGNHDCRDGLVFQLWVGIFLFYFFTFKGTKQRELRSVFMEKGLYFSGNVNT